MLLLYTTGDADAAMKACRRAAVCYLSCRDLAGMGKTLVDEGVVLLNGQAAYGEALRAYEKALELLPDTEPVYRFGATQGSAVAAVYLGDVAGALEHLDGALAELAAQESSLMYASLLWLKGEIALLLEQYLEAADHFLGVWDCCVDLDLSPLETTLVSLRMAKAYFLQGDRRQVRRILHEMVSSLAEVERSHPLLGAALGEFLREGVRGEVTAEALEEIYRKLREGTETAPPLLPLTLPAS
jgi:tetratricopeptide (TPR) repeat protein